MKNNKTSSLTSDLIARKGEALPSNIQNKKNSSIEVNQGKFLRKKRGTIAVTVRLDPERYENLKLYGVYNRLTNQEIIISALDNYLKQN